MVIVPFSTIPSWEGFEYQGHYALYFSLKRIYELIEKNKFELFLFYLVLCIADYLLSLIFDPLEYLIVLRSPFPPVL